MSRLRLSSAVLFLALAAFPVRAADSFSVCWWNIENWGETDRMVDGVRVPNAMKSPKEVAAVVAILRRMNPDILGVAEIVQAPDDRFLKLLRQLLAQAGLDYPYLSTVHGEDTRIQVALLSRFPIRSEEPFDRETFPVALTSPSTGEREEARFRVSRGFLNDRIEVAPGYFLQVMLAHLKSKLPEKSVIGEGGGESGDAYVRRREAELLRKHVDRFAADHPGADLLVMGDFNDTPTSRPLAPFFGSRENPDPAPVRDLPLTDWLGDWWTHFYLPPKSYERIDYMFATPPLYGKFLPKESYLFRPEKGDGPGVRHLRRERPPAALRPLRPSGEGALAFLEDVLRGLERGGEHRDDDDPDDDDLEVALDVGEPAEEPARAAHEDDPGGGPADVEEGELAVVHRPHPGDERGEGAEDGQEPGEDDRLRAVLLEEGVGLVQVALLEDAGVVPEEPGADPRPHGIVEEAAEGGRRGQGGGDDPGVQDAPGRDRADGEEEGVPGQERGEDQPHLAEDDDAEEEVDPVAVVRAGGVQVPVEVQEDVEELVEEGHGARRGVPVFGKLRRLGSALREQSGTAPLFAVDALPARSLS